MSLPHDDEVHSHLVGGDTFLIKGRGLYPDHLVKVAMGTRKMRGSRDSPNMLCQTLVLWANN